MQRVEEVFRGLFGRLSGAEVQDFSNAYISQVGQSATYVEALNTARAAAVQIFKVKLLIGDVAQCLIWFLKLGD